MTADMRDLDPDALIDDRFRVRAKIGEGSQGAVYRVLDINLCRSCALKFLCAEDGDEDSQARFRREGRLGLNLRHLNLVEVYETDKLWLGHPYMVMELLEGMAPLAERWAELDWPKFLVVIEQVAAALDYLAEYDLVHRDLSPSNILVGERGEAKVIDLGLAHEAGSRLTRSSMIDVMGSPGYLAPEQLEHPKGVEPASDQWALAAIVYQGLTGVPPHFHGADDENGPELSALQRLAEGAPLRPPSELNSTISAELEAVVLKALATEPASRFVSACAFARAVALASFGGERLRLCESVENV
jgi:serine/threonine-protein kinase